MSPAGQNSVAKCRIGILLSGRGSNFAAIQAAIESGQLPQAEIGVVISNHADASGLALARNKALPTLALEKQNFETRLAFDTAITQALKAHGVDLLVLAGYDRIVGHPLLSEYAGRILNIHPSLLPAYGGKGMLGQAVHRAVLAAKETESGCTVHVVTDVVDGGAILGQRCVPVLPDDTPEALAARILAQEHQLYPQVIGQFIDQILGQTERPDSHEQDALV